MSDELKKGEEALEIEESELLKSLDILKDLSKAKSCEKEDEGSEEDKKEDEQEDEQNDEQEDEQEEDDDKKEMKNGTETIRKAIEVSDFLHDLVDIVQKSLDGLGKRVDIIEQAVSRNSKVQKEAIDAMVKSLSTVTEEMQGAKVGMEDMAKSLVNYGKDPAHARKSIRVLEKSFGNETDGDPLSKSMVLGKLTEWAISGVNGVTSQDVLRYETGGAIRPEVESKLRQG